MSRDNGTHCEAPTNSCWAGAASPRCDCGCRGCIEARAIGFPRVATRPLTLREQVRAFHVAMNVPADAVRPTVIPDERVRLRASLIAEEFAETMASLFDLDEHPTSAWSLGTIRLQAALQYICEHAPIRVNMSGLADGLADLDYVVEGTRLEMGIDGGPIAAEVHRANMSKVGGPVAENGKRLKPPGWTPPDIAGELRRQGFEG